MKEILSYLGQEFTVEKVSEAKTRVINKRGLFAIIEKSNETTYSVECLLRNRMKRHTQWNATVLDSVGQKATKKR